jgi:hypothetical protein
VIPELAGTVKAIETIEVTISEVLAIASSLSDAEADVDQASTSFKNLTLDVAAFGHSPLGKELGHQHKGAHEVFVETIQGVVADLRDFQQNLRDSMKSHEATDDSAEALLLGLAKKYDGHTYAADSNYDQALHDQAANLTTSNTNTPAPADPAPPPSPSNKPHVAPGGDQPPSGQNQF